MKLLHRFIYFTMMCIILTALVGCPVVQPDDTVKITDLQTAIDKAANNAVLTLSDYPDITKYTATINKPLTIVGSEVLTDLNNATLTITADNVTIKSIFNANVVITTAVKNLCTISDSALEKLTVSGCSIGRDSGLVLDSTTVTSAIFEQNGINYSDLQHLGLTVKNSVSINELKCGTYLAIIDKDRFNDKEKNMIYSLSVTPDDEYGSCFAALPTTLIENKALNIAKVNFYDSTLENSDTPARIDCMVLKDNTGSMVNRDFFKKACEWLLGNVINSNISSNYIGTKVINDVSADIPNMVDTVNITFHNNLQDETTDVRKIIKNGDYILPSIQFDHADNVTLYGWSKNSGTNNQREYDFKHPAQFNQDIDLYAVWKPIYTISYRDRDVSGDVTFDAWTKTSDWTEYVSDEDVTLPGFDDVTKDGYVFQGWYKNINYTGSEITGWRAGQEKGNITLYAKWEYSVSLSDIMFRSGNKTMTVKWTAPNNADLASIRIRCGGKTANVSANAGERGSYTFNNFSNGTGYTCFLNAVDNKGNASAYQTVNNYCGSYIDTNDYNLVIKGTKHQNTAIVKVIDTTTDVSVDNNEGAFKNDVTLLPYYIGKYEVTQELYSAVMSENPSSKIEDMLPVNQITRQQCLKMCRKLNELFGYENASVNDETVDITKEGFRLPTEAEWEFAARGGDPSAAVWGYTYSGSNTINNVAWFVENADKTIHNVGEKAANTLGIYDMSGNVWEWIADQDISAGLYMQCGGGYGQTDSLCTVTSRTADFNGKGSESKVCGFRLAINAGAE